MLGEDALQLRLTSGVFRSCLIQKGNIDMLTSERILYRLNLWYGEALS